ncbi:MAG TPA: alpha-amylase/4-alpha-glucanotransferase domain-containing protein [Candidatus Limnocylindria bacterium]|nr:alpha-amylase/4-alpha-glucanotransferase domain-containing protein [Candidatus Limnocylindria bacterium]
MADRLRVALVFHQHQPAGNPPTVYQEVTERAYAPLVAALYRHPEVKATLHFSGPLIDWLESNRPDVIGDLGDLLKRGQVEMLTAGYYEPILVGVPRRDAVAQIRALTERIVSIFGHRPLGAWLTERVWEPQLPSLLAEAGVAYTTLDEEHFLQAGLRRDELGQSFITEDQGFPLVLFPGNARLRYLIPFKDVRQSIAELRERKDAGARLVVYADDGEKFGAWPGTHQRVHKDGWLDDFFTAIVASSEWLETITLENAWVFDRASRRVYLPGGSYPEMAEWALEAPAARRFTQARNALKDDQASLVASPPWRNFLAKYPEANALHKRMLMVSEELARRSILDSSIEVRQAQQNLWRAQGNDVYWHGVFGGIYLPHLRADAYGSLLKAERILAERRVAAGEQRDYDVDGLEEYLFRGNAGAVFVHVHGGSIIEWDIYASATNLIDTIARRSEAEHDVLRRAEKAGKVKIGKAGDKEAKSIHDVVRAKERGLSKLLDYDPGRRAFFQDSFRVGRGEPVNLHALPYTLTPQREARTVSLILEVPARALTSVPGLGIRKDIRIADEGLAAGVRYRIRNEGDDEIELTFTSASNLALLSEANAADILTLGTRKTTPGKELTNRNVGEILVHSETRHFDITFGIDPPAEVTSRPVYAVANSEAGFERLYEQTELSCSWQVSLDPGEHMDLEIRATAVGQMVEPEATRAPARRRKATTPAGAPVDTSRARR